MNYISSLNLLQRNGLQMISIFALISVVTISAACDLHFSKNGSTLQIATKTQCISFDTNPSDTQVTAGSMINGISTFEQLTAKTKTGVDCANMLKALNTKIWEVAVNQQYPNKTTRPTKKLVSVGITKVLGVYSGVKATIGSTCGKLVKAWNKRYSWREILINNVNYGVVCE